LQLDVLEGSSEQFGENGSRNAAIDLHRICLPRLPHRSPALPVSTGSATPRWSLS